MKRNEYIDYIKRTSKENIKNGIFPDIFDAFSLIGHMALSVSQFELYTFNFFLEKFDLIENYRKKYSREEMIRGMEFEERVLWVGQFNKISSDENFIYSVGTDKKINVLKMSKILKVSKNKITKNLKTGYFAIYIHRIIEMLSDEYDLDWFVEMRKYRNEVVHAVEKTKNNPYDMITNNYLKEFKTIFNADLIADFSYMSYNFRFKHDLRNHEPINHLSQFIEKNIVTFGFALNYNSKSENKILLSNVTLRDSSIMFGGTIGSGKFEYNILSEINFNNVFSNMMSLNIEALLESGVSIRKRDLLTGEIEIIKPD